jgi:Tol biopolymer transport system component/imidazolonepropionase-like amidohydrolase
MITLSKKQSSVVTIFVLCCFMVAPAFSFGIAEEENDSDWDVKQPQGEMKTISIDTTESTWSNLSVSGDGLTLAFDMLGDIYTMPIVGGEATPLVQGFDWNMQPSYSPDGKTIAFISDRDGASNLWTMDASGSNPRQISKETTALIHTPSWSPDGDYIAVTKGFMSSRSIPAGEIWMYHRSGGDGVIVTSRAHGPHTQKNMTDPAFSPNGKYLYYTDDVTEGRIWEYGKNSTTELFNIMRHDLETGESSSYIGGAGGAIVPTPSPDGKSMAYLKRENTKTVLYLKDLESGIDRRLSTEMERDHQETFGSEGNFAYFDWTPDGQYLIYWTGGKFHKLNVENLDVSVIPMHIKIEKQVQQSARYAVDVAPDTFEVKMIRWSSMSPTGDSVVYQALGKLYLRDIKSGRVKRLTRQSDHDEFYPSFSRDGKSIVYTTWNDEDLGTIKVISARGGQGLTITTEPGIYVESKFSPQGDKVVFRRLTGGYLLSPEWSMEPGIYIADRKAKTMSKIIEEGFNAHFAAEEDRVYFTDYAPDSKGTELELYSVDLQGGDERKLLKGDKVTEYQLSPDGKWIAYTHQNNAFVAPFLSTGAQQELGAETSGLPVAQVSKRAGEYLNWSEDSNRLSWSHGATVYSRELNQSFNFLAGAPDELPEPVSEGLDLGFSQDSDKPSSTIALVGGQVVTMRDADNIQEVIDRGVVLVQGNRIVAVGAIGEVVIPADAQQIDVSGKTLTPGLIDGHAHGSQANEEIIPQQNWKNLSSLAFGVTTIHDPSNDSSEIFAASEMQRSGKILGPRIFSTGTIVYGANSPTVHARIDSYEDAFFHLQRLKDMGAVSVKSYNQPRREQRQQVLKAARDLELMVVPEGGGKLYQNMSMIADGHTTLEHSLNIASGYSDLTQFWSQTEVAYNPTLVVAYGGLEGEKYWYDRTNVWENPRLMRYVPRYIVEPRSIRRPTAPDDHYNHIKVASYAKQLRDSGVRVLIGAHGQREGLAAHWEMWMLNQGGFTPWEALRAATHDPSIALGMSDDLGSIEAGKLADIVIMDDEVLNDIRRSEMITYTMINGRLYNVADMSELGSGKSKIDSLFFQRLNINAMPAATAKALEEKSSRHHWVH